VTFVYADSSINSKSPTKQLMEVKSDETGKISLNLKNVDLRDVLSAIAMGMNRNVILVEQPSKVTFQLEDVTYEMALEYLLKTVGMEYISSGNLIIVGKTETLQNDFANQLLLTRFDLNYIKSDVLSRQIDVLGIPIKKLTIEANNKSIWLQGTSQSLSKVRELIGIIDIRENAVNETDKNEKDINLVPFELKFITAQVLDDIIKKIGINADTIILDINPKKIWVYAGEQELSDIQNIVKNVDVEDNIVLDEETQPLKLIPYNLNFISADQLSNIVSQMGIDVKAVTVSSNSYKIWIDSRSKGIADFEELVKKIDTMENSGLMTNITTIKLSYLTSDIFKSIIQQLNIPVNIITLESNLHTLWVVGDTKDIQNVKYVLKNIDVSTVKNDLTYFIYKLSNISPDTAVKRFEYLQINGANVYSLAYPLFTRELLVVCPPNMKTQVTEGLKSIDTKGEKIKVPVDYSDDVSGQARLTARRDLLVKLTGIPAGSFFISGDVSRDSSPHYIMWVDETPENIQKIKDMINLIDNP